MLKKRGAIVDMLRLILSLILTVGSSTFLHACLHDDGSISTCHYAQQMVTALGILLAVLALLSLLLHEDGVRKGLALAGICAGLLTVLTPGILIPVCAMAAMRCRLIMLPSVRLIAGLLTVLSLLEWLLIGREEKGL
ncbi:MAG: DUF4418 family protein [Eubacteriales bacterium]|nr:DUF4418 family protein [Eubacteriales bacterium]